MMTAVGDRLFFAGRRTTGLPWHFTLIHEGQSADILFIPRSTLTGNMTHHPAHAARGYR